MSNMLSPHILGRARLDDRRWAYLIEAPFDMDERATDLIGALIWHDDRECEVRGIIPSMPAAQIRRGQLMEVLVLAS